MERSPPHVSDTVPCSQTLHLLISSYGRMDDYNRDVPDHDSFYLLNLGTSNFLMSSLTPVDHSYSFALQYRKRGPALWSMAPDRAFVVTTIEPASVEPTTVVVCQITTVVDSTLASSSSSVVTVILAGRSSMLFPPRSKIAGIHMTSHPETRSPFRVPVLIR